MTLILFQRGATGWGFQIGRLYWQINYPHYWFLRGRMMDGSRRAALGHWGVEELPPGHPRRWMDFIPQAREDQKRTDYPGCARGIMNCRSTVCGCINESRSNPAFVIARAKLLAEEGDGAMSRVLIVPIPKEGPRGDRDLQRHPYNDYEVHVLGEGEQPSKETLVQEVDGFNHWHTTIEPESQTKAQAQKYGERLAKRLGAPLEWAGEDCEAWTVSMEVIILAKDEAQALELFEQRRRSGEIAPRAYKKRRR